MKFVIKPNKDKENDDTIRIDSEVDPDKMVDVEMVETEFIPKEKWEKGKKFKE